MSPDATDDDDVEEFDDFEAFDGGSTPGFLNGATPLLAILALVVAAGALGFAILTRPSGGDPGSCKKAAWSAVPDAKLLPTDWTLGSTDLSANGLTISILGPAPADSSTNQPVVVASVTCYGDVAATALDTNRTAAEAVSATVTDRSGAVEAYDVSNPNTGATTTFFRLGGLVGQVAESGGVAAADREKITVAIATAMGDRTAAGQGDLAAGDGSSGPPAASGSDAASPSASPFAPDLEALLPRSITASSSATASPGPITLTTQSSSATDLFGQDPSSRAFAARIRAIGGTFDQLQVAQAYDDTGAIDLSVIAFRLPNADLAKFKAAIIETWLAAGAAGVKTSAVTLGGKAMTKVDYGDGSTIEYVYAKADYVMVIDTADLAIATDVATQLK